MLDGRARAMLITGLLLCACGGKSRDAIAARSSSSAGTSGDGGGASGAAGTPATPDPTPAAGGSTAGFEFSPANVPAAILDLPVPQRDFVADDSCASYVIDTNRGLLDCDGLGFQSDDRFALA